jgi:hypothetical protein
MEKSRETEEVDYSNSDVHEIPPTGIRFDAQKLPLTGCGKQ